ncbi:MAG: type IV pilin, partial [Thermoplasmata archaeon]|nr:type IV pilin [Thermoplasmata archaeon]
MSKVKNIWRIRKDSEGVSPVIATILMVAITVVLAAVLYVMVIGIEPPDNVTAGTWNSVESTSQTSARAE